MRGRWIFALLASSLLALTFCVGLALADPPPPPLGTLVDVGGYRVHLYCIGTGSPTVMIVGGGFSFDWGLVQPAVAKFTRVCTYDPSGTAWSDPFPASTAGAPNCADRVGEIRKLLANAPVEGPYVLVGFSIGGFYARLFALNYPNDVAGMAIVDHAFLPSGRDAIKPPQRSLLTEQADTPPVLISQTPITLGIEDDENFAKLPKLDQDLHTWAMSSHPDRPGAETIAECSGSVAAAAKARPQPLGNIPMRVISTRNGSPGYDQLQAALLSLSGGAKQVIAENSSHMVIVDEPEVIVRAIQEIVGATRR